MCGYLFPASSDFAAGDVFVSRGKISNHTLDWNSALKMGVYEVTSAEYWQYINPGPEANNGHLQVYKTLDKIQQVVVYQNGSSYTRVSMGNGWSGWLQYSSIDAFE
jgi:hypothetical protein